MVGNQLAERHIGLAKAQEQGLEDPDLAYFVQGTPAFDGYVRDMLWAQGYAMPVGARHPSADFRTR